MIAFVLCVLVCLAGFALVKIDRMRRPTMRCTRCKRLMTIAIVQDGGITICLKCDKAMKQAEKYAEGLKK